MMAFLILFLACGASPEDSGGTDVDGGATDGGSSDGGSADGGTADGGSDGGEVDGGSTDGGTTDGGASDGGAELVDPFEDEQAVIHPEIGAMFTVSWTQVEETDQAWVEYQVDPDEWRSTPPQAGSLGAHEQLVIGSPYGHDVTWRVVGSAGEDSAQTDDHSIRTDDLPPAVAEVTVDEGDPSAWDPDGHFLLTSVSDSSAWSTSVHFWISILDRQGRYVWLYEAPRGVWTLFAKPARDGAAILWDEPYYWTWTNNDDSQVHRMRLDGTIEHSWSTPWLHHSFDDMAPDTIVWNGLSGNTDIVHVSVGDEPATDLWNCMEWLDSSDAGTGDRTESCANNGLSWHEDSDTVLLSEFEHEMLIALDGTTGLARWYADPSRDVGLAVSDEWHWQHDPTMLSDDRVMIFTATVGGSWDARVGSGAYEFSLDTEAETLDLAWSAIASDWLSDWKGGATRLDSGNTVINFGDLGGAREYTPDGEVVWEVNFDTDPESSTRNHWVGRTTFLDDLYDFVE